MKLRSLPLILAITAGMAGTAAQAATTGNLQFAGTVNAGTCNLSAGDENREIKLPTVKVSDFDNTPGAGLEAFDLVANCESDISTVYFMFSGTPSTGNGTLFANTGTARGIALQLAHRNIVVIPANGTPEQRTREAIRTGGIAFIRMSAAYHTTGEPISSGTLNSAVTVDISYN